MTKHVVHVQRLIRNQSKKEKPKKMDEKTWGGIQLRRITWASKEKEPEGAVGGVHIRIHC